MSTLTKEWLLKTIAELEEERDETPGVVNEDAAKALAAMKLALASLEAKAMTQVLSSRAGNDTATIDKALPEGTMLYTAPPALVSVPDELTREEYKRRFMEEDNFDDTFRGGWSACRAAMLQGADGKPELTVWYGAMPETNGKTNWTAMLHRKGHHPWEGITIDRSEYPGRVRYEADRMRHLIGELADEPDILAYDSDAHSGYVEPVTTAYKLPDDFDFDRFNDVTWLEAVASNPHMHSLTTSTIAMVALELNRKLSDRNSPVIPDGWVACSERMPENDDFVYIWPRKDFGVELHVAQYGKFDKRDAGWYAQVYEQNYGIEYHPITVTHWMPLPAAPQQEVNHG